MQRKRLALFASSIAVTMATSQANALCAQTPESTQTIVRGQFVRCENAASFLRASGANQQYERDLEAAIDRVGEENREELMRRLQEAPSSPLSADFEARVVVIAVDWYASILPWVPGASSSVEFTEEPREFLGTMQYWWQGSVQACEQITALSPLDLWVFPECCDTFEFAAPVCIIEMDYAELAPASMSDALTLAIEGE
jgi:hypothetical protein